jgi:integrase
MNTTFKSAFTRKYPNSRAIINYFEAGAKSPAEWNNLTRINLINFVRYMKDNISQSSARNYAAVFKSVMNDYKEEIDIPCKKFENILNIKAVKPICVYLDEKEIRRLAVYAPKSDGERYVLSTFLLGCLTGARHSDCVRFSRGNIMCDSLVYVSEKTKTKTSVPLSPIVVRLIDDLQGCRPVSEAGNNKAIRRICRNLGLESESKVFKAGKYIEGKKWEFISSHTARRSFATNLYLRGADLYSISKMMGHADTTMTEGYICCGLREQSDRILGYFKKYQ